MKITITSTNSNELHLYKVDYIDKSDNHAEDEVRAENEADAKRQVKPHAYRILSVKLIK